MTTLAKQANLALDLTGKVAAVSGGTQVSFYLPILNEGKPSTKRFLLMSFPPLRIAIVIRESERPFLNDSQKPVLQSISLGGMRNWV